MNQTICNICDKPGAQKSWRLWPNQLPEKHPLRNVALDVKLNPSPRVHNTEDDDFDLCDDHFHELLVAIVERRRLPFTQEEVI